MTKIKAAISLKDGVKINSIELFREYFDFEEIYNILKNDSFIYQNFVVSVFPSYFNSMFFGLHETDGSKRERNAIDLLSFPEKCTEYYPAYYKKNADGNLVKIDVDEFSAYIAIQYESAHYDKKGNLRYADLPGYMDLPDVNGFAKSVNRLLHNISNGGNRLFSPEVAVAVHIYLLLHIQAGILPDESRSYQQLLHIVEENGPMDTRTEKNIVIKESVECFEAGTLYHEKLPGKEKIDLVRISNSSQAQVMVYIADSVLRRAVMPGESVYMLRKAGRYLSFVPRFSVVGETLLLLENGRLCTLWENETSYLDTDIEIPVCWAHSNEYGTFIIDEKGHLDDTNAWPEQLPEKPVVSVSVFGIDYCMLLEDGSVNSRLPKTGWNQVFHASIGLNSGIAIGMDRIPVLQHGTKLPFADAVEAYAMENHYICLNAQGQIKTDSSLSVSETVYAVAICGQGYVLAEKNSIVLISFQNSIMQSWPNISSTEITASDDMIVYYDQNGHIKRLML
ncbi:hypothetical protein [Enterocloster bolteae]|uniref:hypothetical protein n=1 Tax=Enterocloster bolteae TaxID=208479 RepID=UPI0028DBC109|nr:hypothetical protein [Enterocloster bolteae]